MKHPQAKTAMPEGQTEKASSLRVSQPGDSLELEADRVADEVLRSPVTGGLNGANGRSSIQRKCAACEAGGAPCPACSLSVAQRALAGARIPLQRKSTTNEMPAQPQGNVGKAENPSGLPRPLKAGLEALSGMNLSGVQVHNNSSKPAQLNALAYTQGQDIHVGPGQEKHLPHEGWHAVQQMQGRVKSTVQTKGVSINDDAGLEREADVVGAKALQMQQAEPANPMQLRSANGREIEAGHPMPRIGGIRHSVTIQMFGSVGEHKKQGDIGGGGREYRWDEGSKKKGGAKATTIRETTPYKRGTRLPPGEWAHRPDHRKGQDITAPDYWKLKAGEVEFRLTHGDLNMLSGDYFDPRDTNENGKPIKDSLFSLASTPSPKPGKSLGTQDEIIYALYDLNPRDPRFSTQATKEHPGGGIWWPLIKQFSPEVKKSVARRYLRLASVNEDHFVAPAGKAGGTSNARSSAGSAYRYLHEDAVWRARMAGGQDKDIGEAMAREAAAQHFLTDHFASGHIRTQRESIKTYWGRKYPHFFNNFKKRIAIDMANAMNSQRLDLMSTVATVRRFYAETRNTIAEQANGIPEFTFGDLVSLLVHDVENEEGLMVVNDLGDRWKAYGDGSLEKKDEENRNRTAEMIQKAIDFGIQDVENAYLWGVIDGDPYVRDPELNRLMDEATKDKTVEVTVTSVSPPSQPERAEKSKGKDAELDALMKKATDSSMETVFDYVRQNPPRGAKVDSDKYAAEQVLPHVDTSVEKSRQVWMADSLYELWKKPVVQRFGKDGSAQPSEIWGQAIKRAMNGGDIYEKLKGIGDGIDEQKVIDLSIKALEIDTSLPAWFGYVKPKQAYMNGFLKPMQADPLGGLNKIIDFNPADGVLGISADNAVMADLKEMHAGDAKDVPKGEDHMSGLTLNQRVSRVNILASGVVHRSEAEMIVKLIETSAAADRVELYERVAGHEWVGHPKPGKLLSALTPASNVFRVMRLINEGYKK